MPQKMIAFDLVGTLIAGDAFRDARSSLNLDFNQGWSEAAEKSSFATNFDYETVFQALLDAMSPGTLHRQFRAYLVSRVTDYLYPEVCQVLKTLDDQGVRLGFVTDGSNDVEGEMIKRILDHCGIEPDRCTIVTGQDVGGNKAGGKPFDALVAQAKHLGIERTGVTFVGDNPSADIDGAKIAGLKAILIYRRPDITQHKPDREITNLLELL